MTHPDPTPGPDDVTPDALRDEPLDAALLEAARAYHRPPPAPADAMWAAIQARRAAPAARAPEAPNGTPYGAPNMAPNVAPNAAVDELAARRLARRGTSVRRWAPSVAAAVLLVAVGVGIGRQTAPGGARPEVASSGSTSPGAAPSGAAPSGTTSSVALAPGASDVTAASAAREPAPETPSAPPVRQGREPRDAAPRAPAPQLAAGPAPAPGPDAAAAPLRVVTEQHLAQAEALLTTFAAGPGAGGAGGAAAAPDSVWARDLLTTTRLLLDSPAGADPARRGLLETLELVLVQIARLPRADSPAERALIDRAIRRGDLMTRLRSAVPAGAPAARAPLGA